MKSIITLMAIVVLTHSNLYFIDNQEAKTLPLNQIMSTFKDTQQQIYQKVFEHFMKEKVEGWQKKGYTASQIKEEVWKIVSGAGRLWQEMGDFMRFRLKQKLDISDLTQSFKAEIDSNPDKYFLNYEIYDLLIQQ